ncbi:MAG: alpha/beta hydrolase-fold protein [Alphaproteobacteria bacterium]
MSQNHKQKKEQSPFRHLRLAILLLILAFLATPHLRSSLDTIRQNPDQYEHHYSFGLTFPFVGSYYLMKPENYDPAKQYPLVVALHGVSKHAYPAEALAQPDFRKKYPFFIMVPIAPGQAFWATPKNKNYQMDQGALPWPDHLPLVISGIEGIASQYNINKSKIIITGHSMGASGVIGALERYPDYFSGGIGSSGVWDPNQISNIRTPLFIFHGTQDAAVPVHYATALKEAARNKGRLIRVHILENRGHEIGSVIYKSPQVWDNLIAALK